MDKEILTHAQAEAPNEACGLIADGIYYPCQNIAENPAETFAIAPADWQPAQVIVHSHPNGERCLSGADRAAQHRSGLDWWLVVDEQIIKYRYAPLLRGRTFNYGISDCYSIIEDAYMLCGIELMAYKRKGEAQEIADDAFIVNFPETGFYQVNLQNIQAGDVILTSIRGNANHASIYLGEGEVLHHPYGGLSRREMLGGFWHKSHHSVWRHENWQPDMMTAVNNDLRTNNH